jgi:peroxiredoxin
VSDQIEFKGKGGLRLVGDVRGPVGAPNVLLLHGGGQTRYSWGGTAGALADSGFRAYTVDARGHGQSGWAPDGDYTLGAFAADALEVVRTIDGPVYLVGASLGGLASLLLLGEVAPDAAHAVVLVDVVPQYAKAGADRISDFMRENLHTGFASLEEAAASVAAYNPHRPPPRDLSGLSKNLREREGRWYWHWDPAFLTVGTGPNEINDRERMTRASKAIAAPMLLVRGRVSDLVTEDAAREFLAEVPHCEFIDVSGAGHMVAGDRNDAFTAAVVQFLSQVSA